MHRRLAWILTAALLPLYVGCGGGEETSSIEATVAGTVTVNGKLANNGEVTFDASSQKRPNEGLRSAPIGPDGRYKIQAVVGENIVAVAGTLVDQYRGLGYDTLDLEVKPGENIFNIELEWSPPSESSEEP